MKYGQVHDKMPPLVWRVTGRTFSKLYQTCVLLEHVEVMVLLTVALFIFTFVSGKT